MNIQRIRRLSKYDESPLCDYCDGYVQTGYRFSGEYVGGPRSSVFLVVCDACLTKARKSDIGFLNESTQNPKGSVNDQQE